MMLLPLRRHAVGLLLAALLHLRPVSAAPAPLAEWDLTQPDAAAQWQGSPHDCQCSPGADGLTVRITGSDPYFYGPALTLTGARPLRLVVSLRSETGGAGEIFALIPDKGHESVAQFSAPRGEWRTVRLELPPLPQGTRLRLDPPGAAGVCLVRSLRLEPGFEYPAIQWPAWQRPEPASALGLANARLRLLPHPRNAHAVELRVLDRPMAFANLVPRIAYLRDQTVRWTDLAPGTRRDRADALAGASVWRDADGAEWSFASSFTLRPDRVDVDVEVKVSQDREVLFLPLLLVFAGEGSFGARKHQGLVAGLEYLDDEPSSSEADIVGPGSKRQVPFAHQLTAPLLAVQADGRYLGLVWEDPRRVSALYDSPDRLFGSGGHVLGLHWPESTDENRAPGSLFPKAPAKLAANGAVRLHASLLAGAGESVVSALEHFVRLRPPPELPAPGLALPAYAELMTHGWLKSKIRVGDRYRHALAGESFPPQPAADAAVFQTWLAQQASTPEVAAELRAAAGAALGEVHPRHYYHSAVGHIRTPVAALVFGQMADAIEAARADARAALQQFDAEGRVLYKASPGQMDFGKGHSAPDANGLTATVLTRALEGAAFSGDAGLIAEGVAVLRKQHRFRNTVPRGAQTWELSLHTPDILASAYLARAYLKGFELTGERPFLEHAAHWAWTGVPFVYLVNPTGQPVGPYATIAVYGATHWKAPNWMGLPVQWCGLVYADALYRLAPHDASGPWQHLADGITVSGIQQTYPLADRDRGGLLPDSFVLQAQHRNPADINPGTVGACAVRYYTGNTLYDFRAIREAGVWVHAPGKITPGESSAGRARFTVAAWPKASCFVLVNALPRPPQVRLNGSPVPLTAPSEFREAERNLILQLPGGDAEIELRF